MKKTRMILLLVLCLSMLTIGAALATELPEGVKPVVEASTETKNEILTRFEKRAEEYASKVTTMKNGVRVQRTPGTNESQWFYYQVPITYNNYYLQADSRGCNACHADLAEMTANMKVFPEHLNLKNNLGIEITYEMCAQCHGGTSFPEAWDDTFAGLIHMLHTNNAAFTAMNGSCWSCHQVDGEGKMAVWDEVKHSVYRGMTTISSEEVEAEFSWNQDRVVAREDCFNYEWIAADGEIERYGRNHSGLTPDPETDGVYDIWKIKVSGEVDNPVEMTIREWMEVVPLETVTMTMDCLENVSGGPLIANCEVTGFSLVKMMEYAGVHDDVKVLKARAYNEWIIGENENTEQTHDYEWIKQYGGMVVLSIGGEPLDYGQGYPAQFWIAGSNSAGNEKELREIVASSEEFSWDYDVCGLNIYDNLYKDRPNVGIWNLYEGQIFKAGEMIHFSGYAKCPNAHITSFEVSFDQGATWKTYSIEGDDLTKWVCWNLDWMPPAEGAYTITVRGTTDDGWVSAYPVEKLFNVQ